MILFLLGFLCCFFIFIIGLIILVITYNKKYQKQTQKLQMETEDFQRWLEQQAMTAPTDFPFGLDEDYINSIWGVDTSIWEKEREAFKQSWEAELPKKHPKRLED